MSFDQPGLLIYRAHLEFAREQWLAGRSSAPSRRATSDEIAGAVGVAKLIAWASLCEDCLALDSGLDREQVTATLRRIGTTISIRDAVGRCDGCGPETVVYRLA